MAYALSVFFDKETDQAVRALWRTVEDASLSSFLSQGSFHPHLTLAIHENIDTERFHSDLAEYAAQQPPLPVAFSSIGTFPGAEGVVFLAATMTQALLTLHGQLHTLLAEYAQNPVGYYLPGHWNPHCSLARALTREQIGPTVALCQSCLPDTLSGTITHIGIVKTPAEIEMSRFPFQ